MNYFLMVFGLVVFGIGAKQQFLDKKPVKQAGETPEQKAARELKASQDFQKAKDAALSDEKKKEIKELEDKIRILKLESADPAEIKVLESKLAEIKG